MRVMIVDDDSRAIWALKLCLEREGHKVSTENDGASAMIRIREQAPDVLITDINMKYVSGDDLCATLQEEFPERRFPIFVMSSTTAHENQGWLSQIRGAEFFPKPLDTRNLVARIAALAATR